MNKKYIKSFSDFINESSNINTESKSDELWKLSGHNTKKYKEIMRDYLENNLDVENFLKYFSENMLDSLTISIQNKNEDAEHYDGGKDEDGNSFEGGFQMKDIDDFEFNINNDETYGEFGISFYYDNFSKNKYYVSAFDDELDLTDSKLGEVIIETFEKLYNIAFSAAENGMDADYQDAQDMENTYRSIARSNGWSY